MPIKTHHITEAVVAGEAGSFTYDVTMTLGAGALAQAAWRSARTASGSPPAVSTPPFGCGTRPPANGNVFDVLVQSRRNALAARESSAIDLTINGGLHRIHIPSARGQQMLSSSVRPFRRHAQADLVSEISEDMQIAEVERRLANKYAQFPVAEISTIFESAHQKFAQSPIRDFVPLFVERNARALLDKLRTWAPSH